MFGWLARRYPNPGIADVQRWLTPSSVRSFNDRILDVGCGQGDLLYRLFGLGFRNLTGIDPFTPKEIQQPGLRILPRELEVFANENETFDLVMFHHSFEHMAAPLDVLRAANHVLSESGLCLIRIPIASRGPWQMYGTDWAEIDAPRHFFLHTEYSLNLLANEAGMQIARIDYEAEPFSYAASELYRRNLSLYSDEKGRMLSWQDVFTPEEIDRFDILARTRNVPGWAGRAAFYLTRTPPDHLSVELTETT